MQCPVCSSEARNLTPNTLPAIVLGCGTCGDYRIAGDSYASFARLEAPARARALDHAKRASKFGLPMIDGTSLKLS